MATGSKRWWATRAITVISRSSTSKPSASAATSPNPNGADGTGRRTRDPVYRNRRRIHRPRGLRLLRLRAERLERPFAHLYETGGMRRVHLRGHTNIRKRLLIHTGAFNLGLLMRRLIGVGTPRGLQGRVIAVVGILSTLIRSRGELVTHQRSMRGRFQRLSVSRWREKSSSTSAR